MVGGELTQRSGLRAVAFGVVRRLGVFVDLVAIGLPFAVIASVPVAVGLGVAFSPWCALGPVVIGVVALIATWWPRRRLSVPAPAADVRLMAVNLWYLNRHMADAAREILAAEPDVVVVSELGTVVHAVLARAFAHHEVIDVGGPTGHGVYSNLPLQRMPVSDVAEAIVHVRVGGATPFELYGAHLPRPVVLQEPSLGLVEFGDFRVAVARLATVSDRPGVVVAGDLNLSDRQTGYRVLTNGRLDAMRAGRARATFKGHGHWRALSLRIDHIVVPADWGVRDARELPITGSDHLAVMAVIGPR